MTNATIGKRRQAGLLVKVGNRSCLRRHDDRGFTLMDTLATLTVAATVMAVAVPLVTNAFENQRLGIEVRTVERELQSARLSAVSSNRPIIVRFNCPSAGQYRRVELIGTLNTPHADDADARAAIRCAFPFPAADTNPLTRPNNDGPMMQLYQSISFTASQTLQFWPNGTVHVPAATNPWPTLGAAGATITLTKGSTSQSITVNSLGKIRIQ